MIEKTGGIGGLDLPEKAEHTKISRREIVHSAQHHMAPSFIETGQRLLAKVVFKDRQTNRQSYQSQS